VVERYGNDAFVHQAVDALLEMPLRSAVQLPRFVDAFSAIEHEQNDFLDHVRACSEDRGGIVVTDISDREHPVFAKFANYLLFPQSTYSVLLGRIPGALKIALGFNPWGPSPRRHDLGSICRRFGGGGHPVVGGVAFSPLDTSQAQSVLHEIVTILEADPGFTDIEVPATVRRRTRFCPLRSHSTKELTESNWTFVSTTKANSSYSTMRVWRE
jgi:hypothetical protein